LPLSDRKQIAAKCLSFEAIEPLRDKFQSEGARFGQLYRFLETTLTSSGSPDSEQLDSFVQKAIESLLSHAEVERNHGSLNAQLFDAASQNLRAGMAKLS